MKIGDLVKDNHPSWSGRDERIGVVISETTDRYVSMGLNKAFKVLWRDGTIGNNVWDYDLKVLREDR